MHGLHDRRSTARRRVLVAAGAGAIAAPLALFAQQSAKVPRIGFLISEPLPGQARRIDALRAGLRDRGYVEGKNIAIEVRSADADYDRLPALAAELVSLKVDVIVAFGTKAVSAAMRATTTIPIVDPVIGDPVALGLSSSFARPGGNVTGTALFGPETAAKRLEFLKETIPGITRVAVLVNPANYGTTMQLQAMRRTAEVLKLHMQALEVRSPEKSSVQRLPRWRKVASKRSSFRRTRFFEPTPPRSQTLRRSSAFPWRGPRSLLLWAA